MSFCLSLILFINIFNPKPEEMSFYDFKMKTIEGKEISLSEFKGKKVLVVNVASECGFTPQYEDLQNLHEAYGDKIVVLGFPANNFGGQEPGSNLAIQQFCTAKFGVTFQMFEKISVLGKDRAPLYAWLEKESGKAPNWNFCKYLIDEKGKVIAFFPSSVNPLDEAITGTL
ncbi:glutathione peroxidase [Roseivirga ehrenbergii]|uniref:Glutathione peroxidase n=1 Tax=Roseivirga ehrenbergii (strain DSM 102268 / JCM 13514 / KCTC 12282 / NCIMB 14502 / KMM 6017) TaxID=279360 RepID=A0A150XT49_ROSEK|nr:glutathione peroxidase [Roseivirga ehrenbergii]KYG81917.1 glutathione peroxidase [Roseivirga ehrenbergii]TCL01731.1 glutathione peroxidase [Roseivirga ehrenbergii]